MSAKQLQHCMRASKNAKGLVVDDSELIGFPKNRFAMDLYYDGECFIYTDGLSKFIVHPNYKVNHQGSVNTLAHCLGHSLMQEHLLRRNPFFLFHTFFSAKVGDPFLFSKQL